MDEVEVIDAMANEEPDYDDIDSTHTNQSESNDHIYAEPMDRPVSGQGTSRPQASNNSAYDQNIQQPIDPSSRQFPDIGPVSPTVREDYEEMVLIDWNQPLSNRVVLNLNARPRDLVGNL